MPSRTSLDRVDLLLERLRRDDSSHPGFWRRLGDWWAHRRVRRILGIPPEIETSVEQLESIRDLHRLRDTMRASEQQLSPSSNANSVFADLFVTEARRRGVGLDLLRQRRRSILGGLLHDPDQRSQLRDLAALLKRRKHEVKQRLQQRITAQMLLTAFPAWACTSRSLCEVLPAQPRLFDLVVIDEASQCDLALASVALLRAKRVVVVGDPHQLRRVCFLSRAREQASLARCQIPERWQHRFSYRRSLFDVAADMVSQQHFFFLDEHFRSHPQIIDFSNRHFYERDLRIMTRRPSLVPESIVEVQSVAGKRSPDSSVNTVEVDKILANIGEIVGDPHPQKVVSIGIVCPFRDQVDAIRERLIHELTAETIARHQIVVGTAHAFQGDEKDVVFFSTSIDSESHPASLRFLESPNLFNVAITRARARFIVVTSVSPDQLPPGLLRDYLRQAAKPWPELSHSGSSTGDFSHGKTEAAVIDQLHSIGLPTWPDFDAAGHRIPVATIAHGNPVAILCDAANGSSHSTDQQLATHRRLARAGWRVIRVSHRMLATGETTWMEAIRSTESRHRHRFDPHDL
jgi:hypothetical protein